MATTITIGSEQLSVWPEGQEVVSLDPSIKLTRFADFNRNREPIVARLLEEEAQLRQDKPPPSRNHGGQKIRRPDEWGMPEFDLLTARACALFRHVLNCETAVVDACWANVYRKWESIGPHSHRRALASVVCCIDDGDIDPSDPSSGRFAIVDPRVDACSLFEKGRMTNPLYPDMGPGAMLIFPGQTLHYVPAYSGDKPRISASWNINVEALAGSLADPAPIRTDIQR